MNIFENAYFGKVYKTRDNRNAIFIKCATERNDVYFKYYCAIEDLDGIYEVFDSQGRCHRDSDCPIDIISEWKEPLNEEELDKLAEEYALQELGKKHYPEFGEMKRDFKVGYRKGVNNL